MKKLVVLSALALAACGSANKEPVAPTADPAPPATPVTPEAAAASGDVKPPGEAKPGDKSTCTVTGEELEVTADTPHSEHDGKTYYFCCPGCKKKFDADPSKFTKS